MTVNQFAPAKINLYLSILGRRADGFHELETLMAPLSLGDHLEIELLPASDKIVFTCSNPDLGNATNNLASRAARLFFQEFGLKSGLRLHLEKRVPVGAGLGGGSSDAATVLLALRKLTGATCDDARLATLAAQLGSDIPFFIYRQPAICRGRGELITPTRLTESLVGLLVHPGFGISTPWAYKSFARDPGAGVTGRAFADFTLRNDLERPAFAKYPWLPLTKSWFQQQPEVRDALMSGSGSALFALTKTAADSIALRHRFGETFGSHLYAEPFHTLTSSES